MIFGIGIDMADSRRIEKLMEKFADKFAEKYFTDAENEAAQAKTSQEAKIMFYTKRFAAKEACAKALGTGIRDQIKMKNIEVVNDTVGRPLIILHDETREFVSQMLPPQAEARLHVSISDEIPYAVAQVIVEVI